MGEVGLSPKALELYPHESPAASGQRIGLARGPRPRTPSSSWPTSPSRLWTFSIQAQILKTCLKELQQRRHLTYIFISHDLAVVKYMADTIGVMYLGKLVEKLGPALRHLPRGRPIPTRERSSTRSPNPIPSWPAPHAAGTSQGSFPRPCSRRRGCGSGPAAVRPGGLCHRGTAPAALRIPAPSPPATSPCRPRTGEAPADPVRCHRPLAKGWVWPLSGHLCCRRNLERVPQGVTDEIENHHGR